MAQTSPQKVMSPVARWRAATRANPIKGSAAAGKATVRRPAERSTRARLLQPRSKTAKKTMASECQLIQGGKCSGTSQLRTKKTTAASNMTSPKKNAPKGAFLLLGILSQDQPRQEPGRNFGGTVVFAVPPFMTALL